MNYLRSNKYKILIVVGIALFSIYYLYPRSMEGIHASEGVNIANLSNIKEVAITGARESATYTITDEADIAKFLEVFDGMKWRKSLRYPQYVSENYLGYFISIYTYEERENALLVSISLFTPKYMKVNNKKYTIYGSGLDGSKIEELLAEIEPDGSSK